MLDHPTPTDPDEDPKPDPDEDPAVPELTWGVVFVTCFCIMLLMAPV